MTIKRGSPIAGLNGPRCGAVSECDTRSPCGGRALPSSGTFRLMLRRHQLCLLRDLSRFPRGFRWCWSMGPWLGTLQDGSVRMRMGFGDRGLARRDEAGQCVCGWQRCRTAACWGDGSGWWCPLGGPPQWVLRTLWAPMARLLQVAPLARVRYCLHIFHDALGPLEHSVPDETILGLDLLEHSGLDHAETILGPLEHSVFWGGGLDTGLMEGVSHLEPFEHSVLNAARGNCSRMEASVCEPLEHSVRMMTLDDSPMEKMSDDEPLEHSVLDAAVTCRRVVGAPVRPPLQCLIMTMDLARGLRT